jgi:cellulose biosynthesis protein BcsQ
MALINVTLGTKGGIGKSFVAALLAQYLMDNVLANPPICIDLDYVTQTFANYRGLEVQYIDLETDGDIEKRKFDTFVYRIAESEDDDVFVIDCGGNTYKALMNYMTVNNVFNMLLDMGNTIILHVPIMGGQELEDTMSALRDIVTATPPAVMVSVWINQYHGAVESGGKSFEQSETYAETKTRVRSITYIPKWREDMQQDVSEMLKERITFDAALELSRFYLMEKQRLTMAKRYLYQAIEKSGVCS